MGCGGWSGGVGGGGVGGGGGGRKAVGGGEGGGVGALCRRGTVCSEWYASVVVASDIELIFPHSSSCVKKELDLLLSLQSKCKEQNWVNVFINKG